MLTLALFCTIMAFAQGYLNEYDDKKCNYKTDTGYCDPIGFFWKGECCETDRDNIERCGVVSLESDNKCHNCPYGSGEDCGNCYKRCYPDVGKPGTPETCDHFRSKETKFQTYKAVCSYGSYYLLTTKRTCECKLTGGGLAVVVSVVVIFLLIIISCIICCIVCCVCMGKKKGNKGTDQEAGQYQDTDQSYHQEPYQNYPMPAADQSYNQQAYPMPPEQPPQVGYRQGSDAGQNENPGTSPKDEQDPKQPEGSEDKPDAKEKSDADGDQVQAKVDEP